MSGWNPPPDLPGMITRQNLMKRWKISSTPFEAWRKRVTLPNGPIIRTVLHFRLSDVEAIELAGLAPQTPEQRWPNGPVTIDGIEWPFLVAVRKFADLAGLTRNAMTARMRKGSVHTSDVLLRAQGEHINSKGRVSTAKPAELQGMPSGSMIVDGTPMAPSHAASYIARRSIRQPVSVLRQGCRISVVLGPPMARPGLIGTFHRATAAMVAEDLAA